jgi:hypothetical protein
MKRSKKSSSFQRSIRLFILGAASSVKNNKILTLILISAALLRFVGTNPGYSKYHSDEGISYAQGIYMVLEKTLDAHGYAIPYAYPALVPLINAIFDLVLFIPGSFLIYFLNHPRIFLFDITHLGDIAKQLDLILWTEVFGERMVNVIHWGRYVTALFSLGTVFLTYKLAKLSFGRNVALIATLLVTFNFRQVLNSHIGLPDPYNSFFLLLSLIFSYKLIKNPTTRNYILAGICAGLSFSTKFQTFALISLGLSFFYNIFRNKKITVLEEILDKKIFLSVLFLILIPVILNPFHIIHWQETITQLKDVANKYSFGKNQLSIYPYSYLYQFGIGKLLSICSMLGVIFLFRKNFKLAFWFFVPVMYIFYTFTYYTNGGFYTRNFISVTPVLLIFSAYFLNEIYLLLKKGMNSSLSVLIILIVIIIATFIPARDSVINSYYFTKPWGYDVIIEKTEPILPDNAVIASHPFHLISKTHPFKRIDFEFATSYSFAEFKEQGGQYALINMDLASNAFYGWMNQSLPYSLKLWEKPVEMMNNTFYSLSINEMMQYVVADTYKPWQAPDAALFVTKIPNLEDDTTFHIIKQYNFDENTEGWNIQNSEDGNLSLYSYDKKEGQNAGSIVSSSGSVINGIIRISSPQISIKPGHSYRITGYIKSQDIPLDKRNSFIRADFSPSMSSGVSARYYGDGWKKYSFNVLAPVESSNLQISFQNSGSSNSSTWLDNITVEESDNLVKINNSYAVPFKAYRDLLYTNSHGNL